MDWWKGLLLFDYPGRRETTQRIDTFYETLHERANQLTPWEQKNRTETPLEPVGLPLGIKLLGYDKGCPGELANEDKLPGDTGSSGHQAL